MNEIIKIEIIKIRVRPRLEIIFLTAAAEIFMTTLSRPGESSGSRPGWPPPGLPKTGLQAKIQNQNN
ncbi:MAG: hypothetical protein H5U05_06895 [Candidatus Aminicenantes bacterium]|nr:hypothetical protein [Candidatus Aminicenantes bacterium]